MDLYRRNGGSPAPLPEMAFDEAGMAWSGLADNSKGRERCGFELAPPQPAHDPAVQVVRWVDGAWAIEPAPEPDHAPIRIRKYWLFERFTEDQERRFAKLEYRARNLTDTDLDDPAKEGLFQLQRFLRRLGEVEFVELDAAQTLDAFEMLRLMGVFGDPESPASVAALAPILAAPQPHEVA